MSTLAWATLAALPLCLPLAAAELSDGQAPALQQPAQLAATLRVGRVPGRTRMVFDLDGAPRYRVLEQDSQRLLIELQHTALVAPVAPDAFAATPVRAFHQQAASQPDGLALVLELGQAARVESFSLAPDYYGGHRLVVDLYPLPPEQLAEVETQATPAAPLESLLSARGSVAAEAQSAAEVARTPERTLEHRGGPVGGYGEFSAAYTYGDPSHWSQLRTRFELSTSGALGDGLRYRIGARAEADGAFQLEDHIYPEAVKRDQQSDLILREAYLDFSAGNWDYRLGRQHVVWGEVVGMFLADVVSARDTREFFLPEFETMRIPQWAARAERFSGDSHFELLWIPYPSYDEIGKPGTDFYPFPIEPGVKVDEEIPSRSDLGNTGIGARYSRLLGGWDLTGFFYQSNDVSPTLYQTASGLELRHDRIDQFGATFSKAWLDVVLKGEAVYTAGRSFNSLDPLSPYGLEESDSLEYVLGLMLPRGDWRFDLQLYGRHLTDHHPGMLFDDDEYGLTLLANYRFDDRLEAEILYLTGLNRSDYSVQPSLSWSINQRWRLQFGADIFGGEAIGFYGRYDERDRLFLALRRWF